MTDLGPTVPRHPGQLSSRFQSKLIIYLNTINFIPCNPVCSCRLKCICVCRLLGTGTQNLPIAGGVIPEPGLRMANRVVVVDNGFGIFPNAEEQIDFVDQSGYLFGPSLAATLNNVPSALHWWNEESKLLDGESQADCCVVMAHRLIPLLEQQRDTELQDKKMKRQEVDFAYKNSSMKNTNDNMETENRGTDGVHNSARSDNSSVDNDSTSDTTAQILAESIVASVLRPGVGVPLEDTRELRPCTGDHDNVGPRRLSFSDDAQMNSQPVSFMGNEHGDPVSWEFAEDRVPSLALSVSSELSVSNPPFEENESFISTVSIDQSSGRSHDDVVNVYRNEDSEIIEILSSSENLTDDTPIQLRISNVRTLEEFSSQDDDSDNTGPESESQTTDQGNEFNMSRSDRDRQLDLDTSISQIGTSQPLSEIFSGTSSEELTQDNNEEVQDISCSSQVTVVQSSDSAAASADTTTEQAGESAPSCSSGDSYLLDIPEGVDPSFLEALPEDVRREVITEQRRLMRLQQRTAASTSAGTVGEEAAGSSSELIRVSPEFLAALPPALQEEVLAQQRLEQQRQAAATVNPDDPVDTAAFFQNLQPSLRQAILTDIEESQISVLPPELAAEAQNLRRDWEARNRQLMQERFLNQLQTNTALSSILRHSGRGRLGARYAIHTVPQRWPSWNRGDGSNNSASAAVSSGYRMRGRQLLDHESLSCLLVLLFADEPKLNTLRLHRVIRNLCYHGPTREWIVRALLSIIDRSVNVKFETEQPSLRSSKRMLRPGPLSVKLATDPRSVNNNAAWLNIKMDAALGCRANVFIVHRHQTGKRNDRQGSATVTVHPQAAPIVCRHALDLFISLAKNFPNFFLPLKRSKEEDGSDTKGKMSSPVKNKIQEQSDFWDMLLKLDSLSATKKGKSVAKTHTYSNVNIESDNGAFTFETSVFGQLLSMLSSNVITRSPQLTDKLLKLLSLITLGLPEIPVGSSSTKLSIKPRNGKADNMAAFEDSLRLAINVITRKGCSEEGLEDAATLLFNVANCSEEMRYTVFWLMLKGALKLSKEISQQISDLLDELRKINRLDKSSVNVNEPSTSSGERHPKGLICDRFTKESVVITATSKVKQTCDLRLPSMTPLTSKTSSQAFFLRLLRLIAQLHDTIRKSQKNEVPADDERERDRDRDRDRERAQQAESQLSEEYDPSDTPMETSTPCVANRIVLPSGLELEHDVDKEIANLSDMMSLGKLWYTLSQCLLELEHTPDHHAVLVLQPTVEAFFLVHSPAKATTENNMETDEQSDSQDEILSVESSPRTVSNIPPDQHKFLQFAERHRTVLNQILRQTSSHLADGPFSVLVDHTRILDFDVKRKYFRTELERLDNGIRREETAVHVRRSHIFEDSFRELYRRPPEEWKNRFYIVFEDEEGQDAGGLLREWYMIISRDIFNPMYALFTVSPGDRVTYMINSSSHCNPNHLCYYKFVGRVIAKAIYDNKLLECYFTRSFYKHILGIPVKYTDMESEDYTLYKGLVYITENNISDLGYELTFTAELNEFGSTQVRDLIPDGKNIPVTEENKMEYIKLLCQMKMTGAIKQQ